MKTLITLLLLCVLSLCAEAKDVSYNGIGPALIIDVRTAQEFASGHIDGALNIPYEEIGAGVAALKGIAKDSVILVYCRSGRRSAIARATLVERGYIHVLDGGAIDALASKLKPCTGKPC